MNTIYLLFILVIVSFILLLNLWEFATPSERHQFYVSIMTYTHLRIRSTPLFKKFAKYLRTHI